ncbi:MAG: hypothetical protein IJC07_04440 [Clostridia bacterium]|nr:hypothetical protein [Clostridia bacterium]
MAKVIKKKKTKGFINRIMLGKEKSEGYARASLPSNRWELFWDIFKGRFFKLILLNFLTLLFFLPLLGLIIYRYMGIINSGTYYPFSQGFGIGYMAAPSLAGYAEGIVINVNIITLLLLPVALAFASIGIAGGAYVIRNMVWTEGIFVANDFWRGIRQNVMIVLKTMLFYSVILYVCLISISVCNQNIAIDKGAVFFTISKILLYILLFFMTLITLHMITMGVTYEIKFFKLLKNCFFYTIALIIQSTIFFALGGIPFFMILIKWNFFRTLGIVLVFLFGISLFLLVWTNFSQWSYDKFINDNVPGAQKNRGIYEKVKESDAKSLKKYREQVELSSLSTFSTRPMKPIDDDIELAELPTSFKRDDIIKLNESKQRIIEDHERYVAEHMNDERYKPSEEALALQKEREEREKRIEKAKRELAKRNKK